MRGPSELHPVFTLSLNRVAISHEKVNGAVASVQDFVRRPLFTQRNFFSETGVSMLNAAVTAADAVRNSAKFEPWGAIGVEAGPVVADLKSCREKIVSRRKAVNDTRERWFDAETVASPAAGETAPRTTVCISDVVEVGDVQYIEQHDKLGLPCCSRSESSPGKSKEDECQWVLLLQKNSFLLKVRLLGVLHLSLLLRRVLRSRVRDEVVVIAVMTQFSKGDIKNNLIVYLCSSRVWNLLIVWINLEWILLCVVKMRKKRVVVQKFSSEYWEYLNVFRFVSGIKFG